MRDFVLLLLFVYIVMYMTKEHIVPSKIPEKDYIWYMTFIGFAGAILNALQGNPLPVFTWSMLTGIWIYRYFMAGREKKKEDTRF